MQIRRITLRLYPRPAQEAVLESRLELHRQLHNAALEERIDAWRKGRVSISYNDQQNCLPALRRDMPELAPLGSQCMQETLRRLDRAMRAFYRRCAAGQTPGFPRFKAYKRLKSFCYPGPAGWSFFPINHAKGVNSRTAILRVGDLVLRARGMGRFASFTPNDLTVKRVAPGIWEASITLRLSEVDCRRDRSGNDIRGFDQGLTDRLTFDDGSTVENTRLLRSKLAALAHLQQARAKCTRRSRRHRLLGVQIARLYRKVAHQRKDELHKLSSELVSRCAFLASEELNVAGMVRTPRAQPEWGGDGKETGAFLPNGAAAKAGLNRELQSAGFGALLRMLAYKAEEAGTTWRLCNTRRIKPTQRCACCAALVKKRLDERIHACDKCGFCTPRDRNAALVCLIDALWPTYYAAQASKGKVFFAPDGHAWLVRNRLLAAGHKGFSLTRAAHGTGADTGVFFPETPPKSAAAV